MQKQQIIKKEDLEKTYKGKQNGITGEDTVGVGDCVIDPSSSNVNPFLDTEGDGGDWKYTPSH